MEKKRHRKNNEKSKEKLEKKNWNNNIEQQCNNGYKTQLRKRELEKQ